MKFPNSHSIFLALLSLLLSPLAVAHASPAPADSVYFCLLPFDCEQRQRDHSRPATKRLSDCAFCGLLDAFKDQQEEEAETESTSSEGAPDLIVQSPSVNDSILTPGQAFTLHATVHNQGDEQAVATTLRYYRSNNSTITASDTEVGTDAIDALDASATRAESIELTAPTGGGPGVYYGACVASVRGESNTDNNCSSAVKITVSGQEATEEDDGTEEKESESSEDVIEDFLIPEPSVPPLTVRENFELTSFYQQWIDVEGFPVVASEKVSPYAVKEAAWLIR